MATSAAPPPPPQGQGERLNVIALISGGKDSFFSLLHCLAHGHRVVALANLHPPEEHGQGAEGEENEEEDLNSFMYQTVGHQVIPLYAEATGIPLYRQPILGGATQGKDYYNNSHSSFSRSVSKQDGDNNNNNNNNNDDDDETESMLPLLLSIKHAHPEANAICAGAILSTYQRTRVESVATRLGLVPLAFLWKFPFLPVPSYVLPGGPDADAQLLDDMAAAGMEARIIKVASGGLDDSFLWTNVADPQGKARIVRSMRRFGTGAGEKGAVIGEGGEFETLVLDGPRRLFKKRVVVEEKDRRVVREGGGCAWLSFGGGARLEDKAEKGGEVTTDEEEKKKRVEDGEVRIPDLWDARFVKVLEGLSKKSAAGKKGEEVGKLMMAQLSLDPKQEGLLKQEGTLELGQHQSLDDNKVQQWCFFGNSTSSSSSSSESRTSGHSTIETETSSLISQIRQRLQESGNLPSSAILTSTILLRNMADFPAVNAIYGALFDAPNPPSRVCVACGDSLSALASGSSSRSNNSNINIAIYLTVQTSFTNKADQRRQGLHVQSRSYWAPANIGPYSQAISIPLASLSSSQAPSAGSNDVGGPRLVTIAGQIPLVPATMTLPPPVESERETLNTQLTLSLQHLWRIGLEVGVQWWTSAVAYFPADKDSGDMSMSEKSRLAYKTWQSAHEWSPKIASEYDDDSGDENSDDGDDDDEDSDEEEEEGGPDLWDRKFNPKYMTYSVSDQTSSGTSGTSGEPMLPDWKILSNNTKTKKRKRIIIPPFFAAQVSELPRSAGVEWHAHLGIAKASCSKSITVLDGFQTNVDGGKVVEVHQTIVRSATPPTSSSSGHPHGYDDSDDDEEEDSDGAKSTAGPAILQTVLIERQAIDGSSSPAPCKGLDETARLAAYRLMGGQEHLGEAAVEKGRGPSVLVRYVDVAAGGATLDGGVPVVPCASLWSGRGEKLASVTIYQSVFE